MFTCWDHETLLFVCWSLFWSVSHSTLTGEHTHNSLNEWNHYRMNKLTESYLLSFFLKYVYFLKMGHFIHPSLVNQIQVNWMPVIWDFRQSCSSSKHDSFNMVSRNLGLTIMNRSMPIPPRFHKITFRFELYSFISHFRVHMDTVLWQEYGLIQD